MSSPLDAALAAMDDYLAANPTFPSLDVIRARCRAMLRAYDVRWKEDNQKYEVLSVEELITGPIINPETKKQTSYLAAGKIDVMIRDRRTGHVGIMDHKLLSSAIDDDKHEHLLVNSQPLQYALLKHLNGAKVNFALWDCLVKTQHRIRQESSKLIQEAKPERIAARKTTEPDGKVYQKGDVIPARAEIRDVTPGETPEEFEERVLAVYLKNPDEYFLRKRVPILSHNLIEYAQELYDWTALVDSAHRTGKHLKNSGACFEYSRPCKFLGVCSGRSDIEDTSQWIQAGTNHAELELPEGMEQRKVITNSRLNVFRSCQKKHYGQYELGLKKAVEEFDEPLAIGSCGHVGLEQYFQSIKETQKG